MGLEKGKGVDMEQEIRLGEKIWNVVKGIGFFILAIVIFGFCNSMGLVR